MENKQVAVNIIDDYCSKCRLCYSACPFEAILLDADTGKFSIDIEKCQVCGICVSICPSSAIESIYYNYEMLISRIEEQIKASASKNLVVMCRGSSAPSGEMPDVLKKQNLSDFVSVYVPCVGRLAPEFYLRALTIDVDRIVAVQCEDNFCRYKRGSQINEQRVLGLQAVLGQFGYGQDIVKIIKNPSRAVYETEKCVGCDKCDFICPYDAIELQSLSTPLIMDVCKGCGACAVVCPHLAIQVRGFEYENSAQILRKYQAEVEKRKASGRAPVILIFCCQWAEFSALASRNDGFYRENALIVEIPCLTKLDPSQVLQALCQGVDGVMAFGCSEDDCKLAEGRTVVQNNISVLEDVLGRLNMAERFEVCYGSPRYLGDFDIKLDAFIDRVSALVRKTGR